MKSSRGTRAKVKLDGSHPYHLPGLRRTVNLSTVDIHRPNAGTTAERGRTQTSALDAETLRPLVEVAYWSPFVEVKRDAAAAFATLASNPRNLAAMADAGVLGALLALVGLNDESASDSRTQRDAAVALAHLAKVDGVKTRLLKAPDGLNSLFHLADSPHIAVKRAAAQAIDALCTQSEAKQAVVAGGGVQCIFNLSTSTDKPLCRLAARICRRLSLHPDNRTVLTESPLLRHGMILLMQSGDMAVKRDLVNFFHSLAASADSQERLVDAGLLHPLTVHMDLAVVSVDVSLLVMRCLARLALHPENRAVIVEEECIPQLCKLTFHDLPLALAQDPAILVASTAKPKSSRHSVRGPGHDAGRPGPERRAPAGKTSGRPVGGRRLVQASRTTASQQSFSAAPPSVSVADREWSPPRGPGVQAARARLESIDSGIVRVPSVMRLSPGARGADALPTDIVLHPGTVPTVANPGNRRFAGMMAPLGLPPGILVAKQGAEHRRACLAVLIDVAGCAEARDALVRQGCLAPLLEESVIASPLRRTRRAVCETITLLARSGPEETENAANARRERMFEAGAAPAVARCLGPGEDVGMRALAVEALAMLSRCPAARSGFVDLGCVPSLVQLCQVKGDDMAVHAVAALANLAEAEENRPRLLQYDLLSTLIPLIAPRMNRAATRVQGVRAIAALSSEEAARGVIVESGALGFLHAIHRTSGSEHVRLFARMALANLQEDSAALRVQMAFRSHKARQEFAERVRRRKAEQEELLRIKEENEAKLKKYTTQQGDSPARNTQHRASTRDIPAIDNENDNDNDSVASSQGSLPPGAVPPRLHLGNVDSTASLQHHLRRGMDRDDASSPTSTNAGRLSPGRGSPRRRGVMQPAHPLMQGKSPAGAADAKRPNMVLKRRDSGGMVLVRREEVEEEDRAAREEEARLARAREDARRAREREYANATPRTRQRRRRASIVHGATSRPLLDGEGTPGAAEELETLESLVESMMHSTPVASPAIRGPQQAPASADSRNSASPLPISAVPPHVFE